MDSGKNLYNSEVDTPELKDVNEVREEGLIEELGELYDKLNREIETYHQSRKESDKERAHETEMAIYALEHYIDRFAANYIPNDESETNSNSINTGNYNISSHGHIEHLNQLGKVIEVAQEKYLCLREDLSKVEFELVIQRLSEMLTSGSSKDMDIRRASDLAYDFARSHRRTIDAADNLSKQLMEVDAAYFEFHKFQEMYVISYESKR